MIVLYLEENQRSYSLKIDRYLDREDFDIVNSDMKSIYIFFDKDLNGWKIPKKQAWESCLYIERKFGYTVDYKDIQFEKPKIEIETKFKRVCEPFDPNLIKNLKFFNYQLEDIEWGIRRNRLFIASDPGVGKTIEAIAIFSYWYNVGEIDSIFLIVKNQLTFHWECEILDYTNLFKEEDICIITNQNKRFFFKESRPKIIICPNHLLHEVIDSYSKFDLNSLWDKKRIAVVVDECHEIKNLKAKRTKAAFSIKDSFQNRIMLSATPAINGFEDWYAQMKFLDESSVPDSEKMFLLEISSKIGTKWNQWGVSLYDNKKKLEYLNSFRLWVRKRLKKDLPEKKTQQSIKPIYLEMSQKHINIYNLIKNLYLLKYREEKGEVKITEIKNKYPYLIMCLEDPAYLRGKIREEDKTLFKPLESLLNSWKLEDSGKIEYLDEYLHDQIKLAKEKVIVFDNHPFTLNSLVQRYEEYNPLIIHGQLGLDNRARQDIRDKFNDKSSKHKVLFMNPDTGGTGLNLNKACHLTVFLSTPNDATKFRQATERTDRVNSTEDSFVQLLTYGRTLDQRMVKMNLAKAYENDYSFKDELILI
jgi:hypothetical protein